MLHTSKWVELGAYLQSERTQNRLVRTCPTITRLMFWLSWLKELCHGNEHLNITHHRCSFNNEVHGEKNKNRNINKKTESFGDFWNADLFNLSKSLVYDFMQQCYVLAHPGPGFRNSTNSIQIQFGNLSNHKQIVYTSAMTWYFILLLHSNRCSNTLKFCVKRKCGVQMRM